MRIIGEVTAEKVRMVQDADAIYREEIAKAGIDKGLGQYFAALTNMRSVGCMGDERTYDYAVALRAVLTSDFMTAEAAQIPWEVLGKVMNRIVNEVKIQYYQRNDPKDFNGTYIREKDIHLAQGLAQKDYDQKVLRSIEQELNAIIKYLSNYPITYAEQIYEKLHKERRALVEPIVEPEEQYIDKWEAVPYQGKGFSEDTPEFYTAKGERVRSKSELIIADLLNKQAIPYRYEYPIQFKGVGKIYPDFTVLNVKKKKRNVLGTSWDDG